MTAPTTTPARGTSHTPGFVALLLLSAGALLLAGPVAPIAGDAVALVLGTELLVWAYVAREDGPLIGGGILSGLGTGVLLAAGPLLGAEPHVVGGTFLVCLAGGFALLAALTRPWLGQTWPWAWITAIALAVVGTALLSGPATLAALLTWALPAALLGAGAVAVLRWLRA